MYHWHHNALITSGLNLTESTAVQQDDDGVPFASEVRAIWLIRFCDIMFPGHGFVLIDQL